jgi:hypothetical protein
MCLQANMKVFDTIVDNAPEHVMVIPGTCMQHAAGNAIAAVAALLYLICPVFFLARAFLDGTFFANFTEALWDIINGKLEVIKATLLMLAADVAMLLYVHSTMHTIVMARFTFATYTLRYALC